MTPRAAIHISHRSDHMKIKRSNRKSSRKMTGCTYIVDNIP